MSIYKLVAALMAHAESKAGEAKIPPQNIHSYVIGYLSGELKDAFAACPPEYLQKVEATLEKLKKGSEQ